MAVVVEHIVYTNITLTISAPPALYQWGYYEQHLGVKLQFIARQYSRRLFEMAMAGYADLDNATYNWRLIQRVSTAKLNVVAGVGTVNPIFKFVEWNTRPHWPPWKQGTRLAGWSARHGLSPYYVASLIADRGTTGRMIMSDGLKAEAIGFREAVMAAVFQVLTMRARS